MMVADELELDYTLTEDQIQTYRRDGVIKLKQVLSPSTLFEMNEAVTETVMRLYNKDKAFEEAPSLTYARAFQQVMNIWTQSEAVRRFVFSRRLAKIACELMGTTGVRLYHDQALYKASGGGHTPWHADQYYWPLSSDLTCTVWIPLQEVTMDMGPLAFAKGSHLGELSGEDAITEQSDQVIGEKIADKDYLCEPFDLGEISFHAGKLYHHAGENTSPRDRKVMTMIYMDSQMRMTQPWNDNQRADANNWLPGVVCGALCDSYLNPVLYQKEL